MLPVLALAACGADDASLQPMDSREARALEDATAMLATPRPDETVTVIPTEGAT